MPMHTFLFALASLLPAQTDGLAPGTHTRSIRWEGENRAYHVYLPTAYTPDKRWPVVLALHGATMNGKIMEHFSGLTKTAENAGFIVVYPNGTGPANMLLTWNSGPFPQRLTKKHVDDVGMINELLDDLESVVNVDKKRVFCTGMSNGGMMAYRLAAEMSHRIAAIAPVAGTLVVDKFEPKRPVPVLHFHGTKDPLVPFEGFKVKSSLTPFCSVDETIKLCVKACGCADEPEVSELPARIDEPNLKITRKAYNHGKNGAEVILYVVHGGGHVWPGRPSPVGFLGATTYSISANELIWEFFQRHPMK
jgi:polyhydroxybutyrate depolymerase